MLSVKTTEEMTLQSTKDSNGTCPLNDRHSAFWRYFHIRSSEAAQ
jgi:hypothetical protein